MKNLLYKFFSWIKDHFSFLFVVLFRLHIGKMKKESPENSDEVRGKDISDEKEI